MVKGKQKTGKVGVTGKTTRSLRGPCDRNLIGIVGRGDGPYRKKWTDKPMERVKVIQKRVYNVKIPSSTLVR